MFETSESRWFKILLFIAIVMFIGFAIANLVYYSRLRSGQTLTANEITAMLVVNGILLFLALIFFIWTLWRLIDPAEFEMPIPIVMKKVKTVSTPCPAPVSTGCNVLLQ